MNFLSGQDGFFQTGNQPISMRHLSQPYNKVAYKSEVGSRTFQAENPRSELQLGSQISDFLNENPKSVFTKDTPFKLHDFRTKRKHIGSNWQPAMARVNEHMPNVNRDELIRNYFYSGFTYAETCLLLNERHNVQISVPHLKRVLKRLNLRRRNLQFDLENVVYCISQELQGSGSVMGYRAMHQKLRSE